MPKATWNHCSMRDKPTGRLDNDFIRKMIGQHHLTHHLNIPSLGVVDVHPDTCNFVSRCTSATPNEGPLHLWEPLLHMDLNHNHHLQQPLIPTTAATSDGDSAAPPILRGLLFISSVAILSIWANHEASKGFEISVVNDAGDTPHAHRFSLLFLSNDEATRIVLRATKHAHAVLYPNTTHVKKPVSRVTLRLVGRNLTRPDVVRNHDEYVIRVSAAVMGEREAGKAVERAVQRGVARVWVSDGNGDAPEELVEGIVELVSERVGARADGRLPESDDGVCWRDEDCVAVARFLGYCEGLRRGFIGRLNQAMREEWREAMVDDALGMPAQQLCGSYLKLRRFGHVDDRIMASSWSHVSGEGDPRVSLRLVLT